MTQYDIVIFGGRVIDPETGLDAVRNVGIKGDKIAGMTKIWHSGLAMQELGWA